MYRINNKVLEKILKRKFNTLVGTSCETIENLFKEDLEKSVIERLIKDALKKYMYNAMREIQEQISTFSEGTNININFQKPISNEE